MVDAVRERYGMQDLPFVCAGFVENWSNEHRKGADVIEGALAKVCDACGHAKYIDTKGLPSNHEKIGNGDIIHFCRQSLYELGKRYFDEYVAIRK